MMARHTGERVSPLDNLHALVAPIVAVMTLMALDQLSFDLRTLVAVCFVSSLTVAAVAVFVQRPRNVTGTNAAGGGPRDAPLLELSMLALVAAALTWVLCNQQV